MKKILLFLSVLLIVIFILIGFLLFKNKVVLEKNNIPEEIPQNIPENLPEEIKDKKEPIIEKNIPEKSYEDLVVSFDQEFILHKNQTVILKEDSDYKLKITDFIYSPCPEGVHCFWSGLDIITEVTYKNEIIKEPFTFKYSYYILDSDYKTYAKLVLVANTSS